MSSLFQRLKCPNGFSLCFVIATLLLIGLLLYWHATVQYSQYLQHQKQLTKQSVSGARNEISAYIEHLRHQVKIFAQDRQDLLRKLAFEPEDTALFEQLNHDTAAHFPNYFAITIADGLGEPILGNYDLLINELCQSDIKGFVKNGFSYDIFMHPHPEVHHFDVMVPIELDPEHAAASSSVFFISFKPTIIQRILGNAQIYGHNLYLVKNDIKGLIELTADDTRYDLVKQNKNHILGTEELERIDHLLPVTGTRWNLVGIAGPALYTDERNKITRQSLYVFAVFLSISLAYLALLYHLENRQRLSETKLNQVREQLQHTLNFSNVGTWRYDINNKTFEWSDEAQSILTYQKPMTLESYLGITHADDRKNVSQFIHKCIDTGEATTLEHRIINEDSAIHWIELAGSVDKDDTANSHILGLVRDISTRKQAENTRLLHEKQQRNTLIREVHHRIKNNLQGVINLLLRHSKQGDLNQAILKHAISQLNSVSIIHGLSSNANKGHIIVSDLVSAIITAANNFTGTNISFKTISNPQHCHIENEDNAVAMALIMNELIFNAIKHAPSGTSPDVLLDCTDEQAILTITNRCKSRDKSFDFTERVGLGSGLKLVSSLLPKNGATLSINQTGEHMVARFTLDQPVISTFHDSNNTEKQIA